MDKSSKSSRSDKSDKSDQSQSETLVKMSSDAVSELKVRAFKRGVTTGVVIEGLLAGQPPADAGADPRIDALTSSVDDLKKQLVERDRELSALKKAAAGSPVTDAKAVEDVERLNEELKLSAVENARLFAENKRLGAEVAQLKATGGKGEPESVVVARQGVKIDQLVRDRDTARDERDRALEKIKKLEGKS